MNKTVYLIQILDEMLSSKKSPVEVHKIFWDELWDNDWNDANADNELSKFISNDVFWPFEFYDGIHAPVEQTDDENELTELEFVQKCRKFLPKLKELVK